MFAKYFENKWKGCITELHTKAWLVQHMTLENCRFRPSGSVVKPKKCPTESGAPLLLTWSCTSPHSQYFFVALVVVLCTTNVDRGEGARKAKKLETKSEVHNGWSPLVSLRTPAGGVQSKKSRCGIQRAKSYIINARNFSWISRAAFRIRWFNKFQILNQMYLIHQYQILQRLSQRMNYVCSIC